MLPTGGGGQLPRKEGELLKYRNLLSGWSSRFFKLERSYLHYFKNKYTHLPIATITRGEISAVKPSSAFLDRKNVFEIVQTTRTVWYCQSSTPEEMISWIQALSPLSIILNPNLYPTVPIDLSQWHNNNASQSQEEVHYPSIGSTSSSSIGFFSPHPGYDCDHASAPPPYFASNTELISHSANLSPPPYQSPN